MLAYPVSFGPVQYANIRGWLPSNDMILVYWPLVPAEKAVPGFEAAMDRYVGWWVRLAFRHEGIPY